MPPPAGRALAASPWYRPRADAGLAEGSRRRRATRISTSSTLVSRAAWATWCRGGWTIPHVGWYPRVMLSSEPGCVPRISTMHWSSTRTHSGKVEMGYLFSSRISCTVTLSMRLDIWYELPRVGRAARRKRVERCRLL